ncbi:type III toxin-antitoxin system CptIN family toxin [Brevibacillus gelatini]
MLQEHHFYIIDDQYFIDFPDTYLRGNHQEKRPHYFAFQEPSKIGIFWVIPLSSRIHKYRSIMQKKEATGKPCDTLHIMDVAGKEEVFLIQDMFPIVERYIKREYTIRGIPLKLLNKNDIQIIRKKANKVYNLLIRGIKFMPTQPNVMKIRDELLKRIAVEEVLSLKEVAATSDNQSES